MLKKIADSYLKEEYLLGHITKSSLHVKRYTIFRFLDFCNNNNINDLNYIDENIVIDYIFHLKESSKISNITQSNTHYNLKAFFKYLFRKKIIKENFMDDIEGPKFNYPEQDYLEFYEVKQIFNSEKNYATKKTVSRNLLLISMFFTLCLRSGEVVGLLMDDIKLESKTIWIKRKGDIITKFPLNTELMEQIEDWIEVRNDYINSDNDFFFLSNRGKQLTTRQARYIIYNAMKRAGIEKRKMGTHILRHSGATYRLKNGENIKIIQKMLGHTSIATTEKYLHYNESEVKEMINRSPRLS